MGTDSDTHHLEGAEVRKGENTKVLATLAGQSGNRKDGYLKRTLSSRMCNRSTIRRDNPAPLHIRLTYSHSKQSSCFASLDPLIPYTVTFSCAWLPYVDHATLFLI